MTKTVYLDITTIANDELIDEIKCRIAEDLNFEDMMKDAMFHLIDEAYEEGEINKEKELEEELNELETLEIVTTNLLDAAFYYNNKNKPEFVLHARRAMENLDITVY